MSAIKIQRVALPKGTAPKCEICGEPAEYRCSKCPTHYCTVRHFDIDWKGILCKIYQDVAALAERPVAGTEKEREKSGQQSKALQSKILTVSEATAKTWVIEGEYQLAVAGALYAVKMAEQLYGHEAAEAVPAYLLLAEIYLELGQLQSAADLLTLASWSLFKKSNEQDALRPLLYRNLGRLYSAQNRSDEALKSCALDVYLSTGTFGAHAFETALAYYYMVHSSASVTQQLPTDVAPDVFGCSGKEAARVFEKSEKPMRCAFRFYGQVCNIYLSWFEEAERQATPSFPPAKTQSTSYKHCKGDIEIHEAIRITRQIQQLMEDALGEQHKLANVALLATAVLLSSVGDYSNALSLLNHASKRIKKAFGHEHALSIRCHAYVKAIERMQDTT